MKWLFKSKTASFTTAGLPFLKKQTGRHRRSHNKRNSSKIPTTRRSPPSFINSLKKLFSPSKSQVIINPNNDQLKSPIIEPNSTTDDHYQSPDFSNLPHDVIATISATFTLTKLITLSLVCKSWKDALQPLRKAMFYLRLGKVFKYGLNDVIPSWTNALDCFLEAAARGSTYGMVEAGLVYWEMGKTKEGIAFFRNAAQLGDPVGRGHLVNSYLSVDPPNFEEAVRWLYKAAVDVHVRARFQLVLCLRPGCGLALCQQEEDRSYMQFGEGHYLRDSPERYEKRLVRCHKLARGMVTYFIEYGHSNAIFQRALCLFSEGKMKMALIDLDVAAQAGETDATHVKNVILQQFSPTIHNLFP